jgi:hypothetical protein
MKQYEYGVRVVGESTPKYMVDNYQAARDFADGWNTAGHGPQAEVVVRTIEISPWTLHHHERVLAKRKLDAAMDEALNSLRAQGKLDPKWYEV